MRLCVYYDDAYVVSSLEAYRIYPTIALRGTFVVCILLYHIGIYAYTQHIHSHTWYGCEADDNVFVFNWTERCIQAAGFIQVRYVYMYMCGNMIGTLLDQQ